MGFEPEDIRKNDPNNFDTQFEGGGADIDADDLSDASPVAAPRRSIKNVRARSAQQDHSVPFSGERTPGASRRAEGSNPPPVRRPIMRSNSEFGYLFSDTEPVDNHMDDAHSHRLDALAYDGRAKDDGQYADLLEGEQPSMVRRPENRMSAPEPSADRFDRSSRSEAQSSGRRFSRRSRDNTAAQPEPTAFFAPPENAEPAPVAAPAPAEPERRFAERPVDRSDDRQAAPYDRPRNRFPDTDYRRDDRFDDRYRGRGPRPRRYDDDDYAFDYRERRARRQEYDEPQPPAYPPYGQYPAAYPPYGQYPYGYVPYPGYPAYPQYPGYPPYGYPPGYVYGVPPAAIPPGSAAPGDPGAEFPFATVWTEPEAAPAEPMTTIEFPEPDSRSVEDEFSFVQQAAPTQPEPEPEPQPEPEPEPAPAPAPAPPAGGSSRFNRRSRSTGEALAGENSADSSEPAPQRDEPATPAGGSSRFNRRNRSTGETLTGETVSGENSADEAFAGGSSEPSPQNNESAPSGNPGGWFDDDSSAPAESTSFSWDDDDSGSSGGRSSRFSRRSR